MMGNGRIWVVPEYHPSEDKWTGFAVETGVKGTHHNYNVIYNGGCNSQYFSTPEQAMKAARRAIFKSKPSLVDKILAYLSMRSRNGKSMPLTIVNALSGDSIRVRRHAEQVVENFDKGFDTKSTNPFLINEDYGLPDWLRFIPEIQRVLHMEKEQTRFNTWADVHQMD